jgi:hypothetical protein
VKFLFVWPPISPDFQSRFASVAMDEAQLRATVCYVSLNPVRAQLVAIGLGLVYEATLLVPMRV